jgi:hypothetical protein
MTQNHYEQPDPPRGPYEKPLGIYNGGVEIDGIGIYDADGILEAVRIDGRNVSVEGVSLALTALGVNYPRWREPLDADDKWQLSGACE